MVDLRDDAAADAVVAKFSPTHAFYCGWAPKADRAEQVRVNELMIRHALGAAAKPGHLQHAAMVTGLSHYMGPGIEGPFSEDLHQRGGGNPTYYAMEDCLFELAEKHGFSWSVARPATILGYAPGNAMNLGTAVAVYATLAREAGYPFVFPGTAHYYHSLADATDARLLARHLVWEATTPLAANKAFNVVNGDLFRWKTMWGQIAAYFEVDPSPYPGGQTPLATLLVDAESEWQAIVARHGLQPSTLASIAPFWHVDLDLGRPRDTMADMTRSRTMGFLDYQPTWSTFTDLFERLRAERLIP